MKLLLVDNDDCFIHTLANYARQAGAEVVTYRAGTPFEVLDAVHPDMILISPGPGRPEDFRCAPTGEADAAQAGIPVFGVCLGLQGIVEAFGGELAVSPYPVAREAVGGPASGNWRFRGSAGRDRGRALPLALRDPGANAGVARGHGGVERRHHHGRAPP